MRITNKMMTNNMLGNITKNKINMTRLEQQYSTGKKIQRPSDDPIITVRALKLRTNLSELEQYFEKNIPDAKSWMDVTESSLKTVNEILSGINTYCVQGSTDSLTAKDRASIMQNLIEMKNQIYQEGNTNYAGRYVFTGYKTDSPLIFTENTKNLKYDINESFTGEQIQIGSKMIGGYQLSDYDADPPVALDKTPQLINNYRLQLSYNDLDSMNLDQGITYTKLGADGQPEAPVTLGAINTISASDPYAYQPEANSANFIPETGELILSEQYYNELRTATEINISYTKSDFKNGELRPEHYFNCTMTETDKPEKDPVEFHKEKQQIQYEINYNQKLTINTEGSDAIVHNVGRMVDDIVNSINDVVETEGKIAEVNKRLQDKDLTEADKKRYEDMLEQFDTELTLKKDVMQSYFEKGITRSNQEQDRVNVAVADLGSRYVRLEMTENRLSSQKVDFEDLLSTNEDADIVDTYIKYSAAETIYNASLSAASKVVQNTLLDYLR